MDGNSGDERIVVVVACFKRAISVFISRASILGGRSGGSW